MNKSQTPAPLSLRFKFFRLLYLLILSIFVRKISGSENLPKNQAFIVASNHASIMDPALLLAYLTRPLNRLIHFLAKGVYYKIAIFRFFMELTQSIKVDLREEAKSLFLALEYLRHGELVGIFPEGTRSIDGKIKKGKSGVAHLALSAKVAVVPVGTVNTHKILPRGRFFPRWAPCQINIGKPLGFEKYYKEYDQAIAQNNQEKIQEIEESVVRAVMQEIARLSGQEYPY